MNTETELEHELRRLFTSVAAPARLQPTVSPRNRHGSAPAQRRDHRIPRRAMVAVPAVALVAGSIFLTREDVGPLPRTPTRLMVATLPAARALSCRLPISALSADHTTGFIELSHGHATFREVQTEGTTYIPAMGRWASVLPQMVSPDGLWYVTQDYHSNRTIVSVVTHQLRARWSTRRPGECLRRDAVGNPPNR